MKFVHTADIHLDSPLRGLARYPGAPREEMRSATRLALENLVQFCLTEGVELLLIAGDLYDGDWRDYNTGLFFIRQMAQLTSAGVQVVLIRGNHDAASQITRNLRLPAGVTELSTKEPETRIFEDLGIAIHGRGYPQREVNDNLAMTYPEALPDYFNIGLLHTALDGRQGHDPYAPCTLAGLVAKGYQYWALGHIHKREVLCANPWILFPGNLQGRHVNEAGPKGATLVTLTDGMVTEVEHRVLDVVRWTICDVPGVAARCGEEVLDLVREIIAAAMETADRRLLAARVRITGTSQAHRDLTGNPERWMNQIRAAVADLDGEVWVEKVLLRTVSPIDMETLSGQEGPVAELLRALRRLRQDRTALAELLPELDDLKNKLPAEYYQLSDAIDFKDPASLAALVEEVERFLIPRLLDAEESP